MTLWLNSIIICYIMANTGTIELEFNPSLDGLMDDGVRANSQGELETARQILGTDYPRAVAEHFEDPEDPSAQVATARGKRNFGFVFVRMALADDQPDHLAAAEHQLEESAGITRSLIFGNSLPPSDGAAEPSYFNEKSISRLHEEHGATLDVAGRVKGAMATFAIGQNRQDLLAEQRR